MPRWEPLGRERGGRYRELRAERSCGRGGRALAGDAPAAPGTDSARRASCRRGPAVPGHGVRRGDGSVDHPRWAKPEAGLGELRRTRAASDCVLLRAAAQPRLLGTRVLPGGPRCPLRAEAARRRRHTPGPTGPGNATGARATRLRGRLRCRVLGPARGLPRPRRASRYVLARASPARGTERGSERLAADLASGAWDGRHGHLRRLPAFDGGYRIAIAD